MSSIIYQAPKVYNALLGAMNEPDSHTLLLRSSKGIYRVGKGTDKKGNIR